jgi:ribonuclease P protein component
LKKQIRIKKRRDFVKISKSGFYFRSNTVVVQCCSNGMPTCRVGFTASKRVGNAVVRNRCKRRMRSAADIVLSKDGVAGMDYVVIAKSSVFNTDWSNLLGDISYAVNFLNNKVRNKLHAI